MPLIALLTDFGTRDAYVGVMKGVILGIAPTARLVDLSHEVPPQDVRTGAFQLLTSYRYFPKGTVFLSVVDPGVGSSRRALAVRIGDHYFVCPDNGLLTPLLAREPVLEAVAIESPQHRLAQVSATFHGRDLFAPAAAYLAEELAIEALGPSVAPENLVRLDWPEPRQHEGTWQAEVVYADRFGNLVTNLPAAALEGSWHAKVGPSEIGPVRRTYADVALGMPLAYVGSSGFLELAIRGGSALERLKAGVGAQVLLEREQ
jgi:S-adenosyl-L-methionine hydrolase (adenosine-forming)